MTKPTLTQVFGAGATQDATSVTFLKANLLTLTPSATNSAESLLMAIVLTAQQNLTTTARDGDADRKVAVEDGFEQSTYRGTTRYNQIQLSVTAQKLSPASAIDADDY
jgi:hypothetical protein